MRIANFLPLVTLTLGACAVATGDDDDGDNTYLVAAVDRPSGNRIEFHATIDGDVLMSEERPIDNLPTVADEVALVIDPRDYYRALTGGEPPSELADLVEASGLQYQRYAPAELTLADGPRDDRFRARDASWFQDNFCDKYPCADKEWCLLNQRDDQQIRKDNVEGVSAAVCSETGELVFRRALRLRNDWARSPWTVLPGACRHWWYARSNDFDAESSVLEVGTGDKYHHAGMFCTSPVGQCPVFAPWPFD